MLIGLSLLGATGKMGKSILALAANQPNYKVVMGTSRKYLKRPTPQKITNVDINMTSSAKLAIHASDIAIDVSSKYTILHHLKYAKQFSKPLVIGTTGHSIETQKKIEDTAQYIPIFYTPNFSPGISLLLQLVECIKTSRFSKNCCIDIVETHHMHKKDLPSGTAIALAKATGKEIAEDATTKSNSSQVRIHAIRSGEVIGEHQVIFEYGNEQIKLIHQAHSRDVFAQGALAAAAFLIDKKPGLYSGLI
ncbi:4-hydroxy-tetrahydrodipicolinate reductase [Candidatus Rhabdochlamydia oedothoracis]|uniref:4-hydroxy-tetrahydrodipicolinate reductase n=1 Tax=Candidatus Rhabdochlamydia oedothoracis TaxID=2720720 RepID=A0ABX8V241_9BACT|nr:MULTISPECIES: 4-hydroxy-tetrahydrodipicolinate reductase [Rhabdochlamydia]KAG6559674.1 4-hydroxy-tetrahydrodipicolinate reductase [Candidatus Rhabdochlamydia sp. W815]MCL6756000.1 4-hydroxy-tetrahydrodipicolinate reductase [Candidatus Rhabdochlamydia oedothoracis]QYF49307.1 4-hydroxy-tetrahydrodipicolinate reductase [Candidatus Rhabdochlamydia oedothoracis]